MQTTELREYILPLRRWWWLILASVAVAAASSAIYTLTRPDLYQSRATVMVGAAIQDPNPDSMQFWLSQELAATYANLAQRQSVREGVMAELGMEWLPTYSVAAVPNSQLMEIAVTDTDPARAQAVANAFVSQLILRSPAGREEQARQEFVAQELAEMEEGIRATKDEITRRQEELTGMFSARQIADAQSQIGALESKLASLQGNYTALLSTTQRGAVNTINVIEPANLPAAPLPSQLMWNLALALAIGFLLAVGGAYLIEYMDDSVKNSDQVQRELGLPTLAAIPDLPQDDKMGELVMLGNMQSPGAESFRVLRTNLQFASVAHALDRVLVTSPSPGEGKSTVAANLAVALAQTGRQVVLIDADLHRPRQHKIFRLVNSMGLTTALLSGDLHADEFLQRTPLPHLRVLTTGPLPPNPAELLGSQRMHDLLVALSAHADIVVVDSPPTTAVADTAVVSGLVDGVVLVMETGKTRREAAKRGIATLKQVHGNLVGVVLNRMPARGGGYYYYNYRYDHKYYRRDDGLNDGTALPVLSPYAKTAVNGSNGGANGVAGDNGQATPADRIPSGRGEA